MILLKDGQIPGRTTTPFGGATSRPKMFTGISRRGPRRSVVVEFNPNQILAAEISRPNQGPAVIESAAEFDHDDTVGLGRWIGAEADGSKAWLPAICGLVPARGILHRETLLPKQLTEVEYIAGVIEHQEKGHSVTVAPFQVIEPFSWTLRAVSAVDGTPLVEIDQPRPALVCGVIEEDLKRVQQRLLDDGLVAERLEPGLLPLFGTIYGCMERNRDNRAVVLAIIQAKFTSVYILGKEGVHTPNPVLHGFDSIVDLAKKELGIEDEVEIRRRLRDGDRVLVEHAGKLVRRIGRDLKPVVDSYEMTTGQPVEEVFCPYLPLGLAWMGGPLARVIGRTAMTIDCEDWLTRARLRPSDEVKGIGPHWLGVLSLAADLPEPASLKASRSTENSAYQRPWHVNFQPETELSPQLMVGRGFMTWAIATAVVLLVASVTVWQLYVTHSLRTDTAYWETRMVDNRQLFDELTTASTQLKAQSGVLRFAYDLMNAPFAHTDFMLNLGRTLPARMRIDRIETNDVQVTLAGILFEPAEEASETLSHYMEDLRRNRAVGPLFSTISLKSLHRRTGTDDVAFVITLRVKPVHP